METEPPHNHLPFHVERRLPGRRTMSQPALVLNGGTSGTASAPVRVRLNA